MSHWIHWDWKQWWGAGTETAPNSLEKSVLHKVLLQIPHSHLGRSGFPALVPKSGFRNVKGRSEREEGQTLGLKGPFSSFPASPAGFSKQGQPPDFPHARGEWVETLQQLRVLWSWSGGTSCQAHFGSKTKKKKIYQQNLMLMERTMPESTVKPSEGVESNVSFPCIFLGCVCGLTNFVIPVKCWKCISSSL